MRGLDAGRLFTITTLSFAGFCLFLPYLFHGPFFFFFFPAHANWWKYCFYLCLSCFGIFATSFGAHLIPRLSLSMSSSLLCLFFPLFTLPSPLHSCSRGCWSSHRQEPVCTSHLLTSQSEIFLDHLSEQWSPSNISVADLSHLIRFDQAWQAFPRRQFIQTWLIVDLVPSRKYILFTNSLILISCLEVAEGASVVCVFQSPVTGTACGSHGPNMLDPGLFYRYLSRGTAEYYELLVWSSQESGCKYLPQPEVHFS